MYKNREIYDIACKSIVLTCLEMSFVRLVYINDLISCCSYCFTIYNNSNNNDNDIYYYYYYYYYYYHYHYHYHYYYYYYYNLV